MKENLSVQTFLTKPNKACNGQPFINILWPCNLYTVVLKCRSNILNIFETTVLRLIAINVTKPNVISNEYLTLDTDLIRFIFSRLEQKGMIENDSITELGQSTLQNLDKGIDTVAYMYADLIGGKLLPFTSIDKPTFLLPTEDERGYYLNEIGDVDNILREYKVLKTPQCIDLNFQDSEFISILKIFESINRSTPRLPEARDRNTPTLILNGKSAIKCQPNPQKILLHCVCVMGDDGNILVLNPFGYADIIPDLTESLNNYSEYDDLKQLLLDQADRSKAKLAIQTNNRADGIDPKLLSGFAEVDQEIRAAYRALQDYEGMLPKSLPTNKTEQSPWVNRYLASRQCAFIQSIYVAIECILNRIRLSISDTKVNEILENSSTTQISSYAVQAATDLGLKVSSQTINFLKISPNEVKATIQGKCSLRSLLIIVLIMSNYMDNYVTTALRIMVSSDPFLLNSLKKLKELRDPLSHGGTVPNVSTNEMHNFFEVYEKLLQACPKSKSSQKANQESNKESMINDYAPSREDVERELITYFSQRKRNLLSDHALRELQLTEYKFQSKGISGPYASEKTLKQQVSVQCITNLASLYQNILQDLLEQRNLMSPSVNTDTAPTIDETEEQDISEGEQNNDSAKSWQSSYLLNKLGNAGFTLDNGLPKCLQFNQEKLNNALKKKRGTLGQYFVIFVQSMDLMDLSALAKTRPELIQNVTKLIELRAHGQGLVDGTNAAHLRNEIYNDCVAILGE